MLNAGLYVAQRYCDCTANGNWFVQKEIQCRLVFAGKYRTYSFPYAAEIINKYGSHESKLDSCLMKSSQAYQAGCGKMSPTTIVWIAAFVPLSLRDAYMDTG
jgi:hypothetical protein